MNNPELPQLYIEYSIQKLRNQGLMTTVDRHISDEMRDTTIACESRGWVGWKIVPSTVTDDELNALETRLGLKYPPLYRSFLQTYHFYELGELRFCQHAFGTWQGSLEEQYQAYSKLVKLGLIPFADETLMDAGAICFDTRFRDNNGDCPIVFWDHEWVGTDKEIQPLFSSSEAMFRCLTFMAQSPLDFVYHDNDYDDPSTITVKKKLLSEFLALDPKGAGGIARGYWINWGVYPLNDLLLHLGYARSL